MISFIPFALFNITFFNYSFIAITWFSLFFSACFSLKHDKYLSFYFLNKQELLLQWNMYIFTCICMFEIMCQDYGVSYAWPSYDLGWVLLFTSDRNKSGKCLYTCAVRPAAIYGPGEERHLPRIIKLAKLGLVPFKIGAANVKTDWVYVDNLVLALLLASMGLLDDIPGREGQPVAAGQPYFISDGKFDH